MTSAAPAECPWPGLGVDDYSALGLDVAEFAEPRYSRTLVKKAGNVLAKVIPPPATEAEKAELSRWFTVAHNWRSAHIVPMHGIRAELGGRARSQETQSVVVARLKRMISIRRKLQSRSLHQIQDIGGCRAIFWDMKSVLRTVETYTSGDTKHVFENEHDDYIAQPKEDGYRSHHLVLRYNGSGKRAIYNGLRIEIQLRTRVQHAWATAVEAVGLYRNEDLKGGSGNADWLKFFRLVSSEIALSEELPIVPGTPKEAKERRQEIAHLSNRLSVLNTLDGFRRAIKKTEDIWQTEAKYYLVQFDHRTHEVTVTPYDNIVVGSRAYDAEDSKSDPKNAVLVEVDKVDDLKDAYPNYFLDVALFTKGLRNVLDGKDFGIFTPTSGSSQTQAVAKAGQYDLAAILRSWHQHR